MSGESSPDEIRRRAEFGQHVANLREISLEELNVFDSDDLEEVREFQEQVAVSGLIQTLYPQTFVDKYGDKARALEDNLGFYDEATEDAIMADKVVLKLMEARRTDSRNLRMVSALRARRSITAILFNQAEGKLPVIKLPKKRAAKTKKIA